MKRIKWGELFEEQRKPDFADPNPRPIPTVRGHRYAMDERTDIRLFQYHTGDWGVQVTVMRSASAKSLGDAKRKARGLVTEMTEKPR